MISIRQLLLLFTLTHAAVADFQLLLIGPGRPGASPCCTLTQMFQTCYDEKFEMIHHQLACTIKVSLPWTMRTIEETTGFARDLAQSTGYQLLALNLADEQTYIYVDAPTYDDPERLKSKIAEPKHDIAVMAHIERSANSFIIKIRNPFDLDKPEWNRMVRLLNSWKGALGELVCYAILYPPKTELQGYFLWSETNPIKEARIKGQLAGKVKEICCHLDERVLDCEVVDYEGFFKAAVFACWTRITWFNSNPLQPTMTKLWSNRPDYIYSVITRNVPQIAFDVQLVTRRPAVQPRFVFEYFTNFVWKPTENNHLQIELTNLEHKNIILHGLWLQAVLILAQIEKHTDISTSLTPILRYPQAPKTTNEAMQARREVLLLVRDDPFQTRDPCTLLDPSLDAERSFTPHDCRNLGAVPVSQDTYKLYLVHLNVWVTPHKFEHFIINRNLIPDKCSTTVINTLSSMCYGSYRVIEDPNAQAGATAMPLPNYFQIVITTDVHAVMQLYGTQQVTCPWILDQLNGVCRTCDEGHMDQERLEFRLECEYFLVREVLPRVMEINKKLNEGSEECVFNVRFFHEYKNAEDAVRARHVTPSEDCFHNKIY